MLLAKEVINDARLILSDLDRDRWSDERLLVLLNNGISDIAIRSTLFIESVFYPIADNVVDIDLSAIAVKLVRAEYLDEPLPLKSFDEMDREKPAWQKDEGDKPKAVVHNYQAGGLYKLYPIVTNAYNPYIVQSSNFGIVTEISYSDILPVLANSIGDIQGVTAQGMLKLYYVRKHAKIIDINTECKIDNLCKIMLSHYIAGFAFRDNQDTQNRTLANEELGIYENMLSSYSIEKFYNMSRAERSATYNPLGA